MNQDLMNQDLMNQDLMNQDRSTEGAEKDADTQVDIALRQALDPDEATVRRVLTQALAEAPPVAAAPWRLAAAVAVAALVIAALSLSLLVPKDPPSTRVTSSDPAAVTKPAVLAISNPDGLVTVTTPAGSKMVLLPVIPQPGDAS